MINKEHSSLSYKEILEMKEKKAIELMPPPKPLIRAKYDAVQEFRKNLMETPINAQQNLQLQDELYKIHLMNKDINSQNILNDNISIYNKSLYQFQFKNFYDNNTVFSEEDFALNCGNNINNNIQKLKKNLSTINEKEKEILIKYNKFPSPKNKREIKYFVNNLISYINYLFTCPIVKSNEKLFDELQILKFKLETRYNDYRNNGLYENYFINALNQQQNELIKKLTEITQNNKKEENIVGKNNSITTKSNDINDIYSETSNKNNSISNYIKIRSSYSFIGKKRKKSLSELKSITDGSSSYEFNNIDSF